MEKWTKKQELKIENDKLKIIEERNLIVNYVKF